MNVQSSFAGMTQRIAHQFTGLVTKQLQKLDLDAVLGTVGLQLAKRPTGLLAPMLAAFGAGMAVGALLTPMSGKQLRTTLAAVLAKSKQHPAGQPAIDGAQTESPYEQAARGRRDDASGNNGQKKSVRVADAPLPT